MIDSTATLRRSVYLLLIALAVGNMVGRILAVDSVDLTRLERQRIDERMRDYRVELANEQLSDSEIAERLSRKRAEVAKKLRLGRPFLSANDRSRWMASRALVEQGTFAIDEILKEPTWDSIDIVRHKGADGEFHFYSSKPPLTYLHMAAGYWLLNRTTGLSLADDPYAAGRILLLLINVLPMVVMFVVVVDVIERLGTGDFARLFAMAVITFGTLLSAFAVVANNHTWAAACASVAVWAYVRMRQSGAATPGLTIVTGMAAALTAACELPALAFLALLSLAFLVRWPKATFAWFSPAALIVIVAYFGANHYAHDSWRPPYMHRNGDINAEDNWYLYTYTDDKGVERSSYWTNRQGIDAGEPNKVVYALHALIGHHGVFSLTPVWILAMVGGLMWLARGGGLERELAAATISLTIICLAFYINRPLEDRNYGGMTQGFRWMFWFAPLWTITLLPAAKSLDCCRLGRAIALTLLAWSAMSAAYPTWNPWTQPWIWDWMEYVGVK